MLSEIARVYRPAMLTASRAGWSSPDRLSHHREGPRPWQGPQNQTMSPTFGWSRQRMPRAGAVIPVPLGVWNHKPDRREKTRPGL